MTERDLARRLRGLFATLAAILALAAGVAVGVAWYQQGQVEREATRDARRLAVDVLVPMLAPSDVEAPVRGDRYDELLAAVRQRILSGPITGVRLWRADGLILFAEDPELVGVKDPDMRDDVHAVVSGTAESSVRGGRFRTLASLRVGEPPIVVAVELDRSHGELVAEVRDRWDPWATRAGVAAGVCVVLAVAASVVSAAATTVRRRAARRRSSAGAARAAGPRAPAAAPVGDPPLYMHPGFQDEIEARRAVERERDELLERVRRLESDLAQARRLVESNGPEPTVAAR
jgi:hypothetical protein